MVCLITNFKQPICVYKFTIDVHASSTPMTHDCIFSQVMTILKETNKTGNVCYVTTKDFYLVVGAPFYEDCARQQLALDISQPLVFRSVSRLWVKGCHLPCIYPYR